MWQGVKGGESDPHPDVPTAPSADLPANYKWVALFISTLGMLMATIDGSIVLIALPDIFRGIGTRPAPARATPSTCSG